MSYMLKEKKKVIVVGGGFAGIETMKSLIKEKGIDPVLFSDKSYFEYYPALYRIVTGASPIEGGRGFASVLFLFGHGQVSSLCQ